MTPTTTLIRIDRSTFRKNPRAGETRSVIATGPNQATVVVNNESGEYTLRSIGEVEDEGRSVTAEWICERSRWAGGDTLFACGGEVGRRRFSLDDGTASEIRVDVPLADYCHRPLPPYLFDYAPTLLTCKSCGATFPHTELHSDSAFNGDGEDYSPAVCPKCDAWDCCQVEYEKSADVANELGLVVRLPLTPAR